VKPPISIELSWTSFPDSVVGLSASQGTFGLSSVSNLDADSFGSASGKRPQSISSAGCTGSDFSPDNILEMVTDSWSSDRGDEPVKNFFLPLWTNFGYFSWTDKEEVGPADIQMARAKMDYQTLNCKEGNKLIKKANVDAA